MNKSYFEKNNFKKYNLVKALFLFFKIFKKIDHLSKLNKIIIFIFFDYLLIIFACLLTNYFLSGIDQAYEINQFTLRIIPILIAITSLFYLFNGEYVSLSRYISSSDIYNIARRNFFQIIILCIIENTFFPDPGNFKIYSFLWIISTFANILSRFIIKEILIYAGYLQSKKIRKVAIYGAGAAGAQLASSLMLDGSHKIIVFFDDSKDLWGRKLLGIRIHSSKDIYEFKNKIDQILFAIPSLNKVNAKMILEQIKEKEIPVLQVPSIKDLTTGNLSINSLRPIEIEELLGRESAVPNSQFLKESIKDLNICITGAGGSIGKEIFKQILNLQPKSILLIDCNEFSLYSLEQESLEIQNKKYDFKIFYKLGNVKNLNLMESLFKRYKIDVVFHAAAYKHVPLIEKNSLEGISNNIIGTYSICRAAEKVNLSKVTLISTDKAVRPTNIMGASKRFSELIVQGFAEKIKNQNSKYGNKNLNTLKFSIVRFGNVLGSSGSVVPLFKKQISSGGPITLTDERIIRYFMTISEAAQLVIQSTSLSEGGDLFVLDMGDPVKIKDLAKQMIRLSGLKVKDSKYPNGDIEIITTGLRPGEKLYEELLTEGKPIKTLHPLIFRVKELNFSYDEIIEGVKNIDNAINNLDEKKALELLSKFIPEWKKSL